MDPVSITAGCLSAAKCAYAAVNQVKQTCQQLSHAEFDIDCLHTEVSNAKVIIENIVSPIEPQLALVTDDIVIAICQSLSTCQRALEIIQEEANKLNADLRRDRIRHVWNEGFKRQRDQLKSQIEWLQWVCEIVRNSNPREQQSAMIRLPSNGQVLNAELEDDSGDDESANSLRGNLPSRDPTEFPGAPRRRRRSLHLMRHSRRKVSRALIQAALTGDVAEMERLYDQRADVNYQSQKQPPDNEGMTALHAAAKGGHYRAVEFLIQREADVNALMIHKFTPLHLAVTAQHTQVVQYLIDRGANVNAQNAQGQTPLFKSDRQITRMLLKAQANPNVIDNGVNTSLHYAAYNNHVEAIKLLTGANANVNISNWEGKTALWLVCDHADMLNLQRSLKSVDILLQRRADPNISCKEGKSPLELCIYKNESTLADRLLKAGADANIPTRGGDTLLHKAAALQSSGIMCLLLPSYRNIDIPAQYKRYTPLHMAIDRESPACTRKLLERGASVTVREGSGKTALHIAAGAKEDSLVEILLQYNANVHESDRYYRTPLFYAQQSPAVAICLLNAGASLTATDQIQNSPLHHLVHNANPAVIETLLECGISVTAINRAGHTPLEGLCADEQGWNEASNPSTLSPNRLKIFHLLLKYKSSITPRCRASIAGWHNVRLRNALMNQLPWRWPSEVLADNADTLGYAATAVSALGIVGGVVMNMKRR